MKVASLISFITAAAAAPVVLKKRGWDYSTETFNGINIGGWLVLEPFITPSLFEAVSSTDPPIDEYHYCQTLGSDEASTRLQSHWSTWINETDFENIANLGLNWVRIPVGYWAFQTLDGDPYVQGQQDYIDKAVGWARKYNLKIWLDLHGAPGSQNGFDNSGYRDSVYWQTGDNVQTTLDIMKTIANKYSGDDYNDVIYAIELLNEPLGTELDMTQVVSYYESGYELVRDAGDLAVIIHDAFQADHYFDNVLNTDDDSSYTNVLVDHHHYQVFSTGELQETLDTHIATACGWAATEGNEYHWNVAGEFTAALTDCAKWLNGASRGARYDGTYGGGAYVGSCDQLYTYNADYWTDDVIATYRKYVEAQLDALSQGKIRGWFFWCWKTESAVDWSFKDLVTLGVIPQPLSDRQYPNQCGF